MGCPDPDRVLDYLARRLAPADRDAVETHVDTCSDCRELLGELTRAREVIEVVPIDPMREVAGYERYDVGQVIGAGGMGEIRIAQDTRIHREVAIKLMQAPLEPARMVRFFREARVQGGLEHPAVVPVHDLGIDADGKPYFVMKRLVGTTLADQLVHADDRARRALLGNLADICLAIAFAHTRGVIHRDLKPRNIMLGDFGEAYVLDWGLARVAGERAESAGIARDDPASADTRTGELLGTLGYMAPEQVRGETIDVRADVFALGCILYEILAGEPALPRGRPAIDATLAAPCHRPSARGSVPPELDDLCARATAAAAADRPTSRELAAGIRAYLDGDRDLARRRELADHHADAAEAALAGAGASDATRATAMREAGRALALDPDHARAQAVLGGLLLETPAAIPAGARASSDDERSAMRRHVAKRSAATYLAIALGTLMFFAFPTRHGWSIVLLAAENASMGLLLLVLARRALPVRTRWYFVTLGLNIAILATGALMFGPLLVVPVFVVGSLAVWLNLPTGYPSWITVVAHLLAVVPFVVLELIGLLPTTFTLEGNRLVLTTNAIDLTPVVTTLMLVITFLSQLATVVYIGVYSRRIHDATRDRLHAHTWHLGQLLPRQSAGRGTIART